MVQVIGIDYVGIGSDFDGGGGVEGCRTVAEMKNITIELLRRGYTTSDIKKIWGGNFMRVFRKVEEVAENQRAHRVQYLTLLPSYVLDSTTPWGELKSLTLENLQAF